MFNVDLLTMQCLPSVYTSVLIYFVTVFKCGFSLGLFAIAFAVEIAYNGLDMMESLQAINFEQSKMGDHLNRCLQVNVLRLFPKSSSDCGHLDFPLIMYIEPEDCHPNEV